VGFSGKRTENEVFFKFTSFLEPGAAYRIADVKKGDAPEMVRTTELAGKNFAQI